MGSIRAALAEAGAALDGRRLWGAATDVRLADAGATTCLDWHAPALADRSVVVAARDQFAAALALIELDGTAHRLLLCTPDVTDDQLAPLAARAGADALVTDGHRSTPDTSGLLQVHCTADWRPDRQPRPPHCATEWLLLTSGTAGPPKIVRHTFSTLTAAIAPRGATASDPASAVVWGTFYDIRRYGGLQVLFRALVGGGSLVVGAPDETIAAYLDRLATHGATHITGTPSHWRRVLMTPNADAIAPRYIRLSGEIADQSILDALRVRYPAARIAHAFASTEAGVGFEVDDGRAGFPAALLATPGDVQIRVDQGSLRLRSSRTAAAYLEAADGPLAGEDGFVDTGDAVERRGDRLFFLGRRNGVINIGGLKVHPEEVESAINRHPCVRMSKVRARHSPITGALVAADVVLETMADATASTREILAICRGMLPPHKVPAVIRVVPSLELALTGKLARHAT